MKEGNKEGKKERVQGRKREYLWAKTIYILLFFHIFKGTWKGKAN